MKTLNEQSSSPVPDKHRHACEWCGQTFTHQKSRIPEGKGHEAHQCPNCGNPVNSVQEPVTDMKDADWPNWYGRDVQPLKATRDANLTAYRMNRGKKG